MMKSRGSCCCQIASICCACCEPIFWSCTSTQEKSTGHCPWKTSCTVSTIADTTLSVIADNIHHTKLKHCTTTEAHFNLVGMIALLTATTLPLVVIIIIVIFVVPLVQHSLFLRLLFFGCF